MVQRVIHVLQTAEVRHAKCASALGYLGLRGRERNNDAAVGAEEQIRGVAELTAGLYGDLQRIAGRSLLEIDGLELPLLDRPTTAGAEEVLIAR